MAKVGRPKSNIESKRIQCVIPKDILDKLDAKVNLSKEKNHGSI